MQRLQRQLEELSLAKERAKAQAAEKITAAQEAAMAAKVQAA